MMSRVFTDMLGREIMLDAVPSRIVSLVPSQTELLYDLGLDEKVVGITKFCIHPREWFRTKSRVGGTKQVHADKVAALRPDLIIANKEENVKEQVDALAAIAPVWISDIKNVDDALEMIARIGELTGKMPQSIQLVKKIEHDFQSLNPQHSVPLKIAYGIWRNPWMWAGGDTFIADVIRRMGMENALQHVTRYPAIDLEALVQYKPDVVLLSSEPYPFKEAHVAEVKALLPDARISLVDGELFSWYGSRLLHAASYLNSLILRLHEK